MNKLNIANLVAYIYNVFVTFGVGQFQIGGYGTGDIGDLSDKYQTIITPNGTAFSIWGIIFFVQAAFAIAQLLPKFKNSVLVQQGVGYWYIGTCVVQSGWTFTFLQEQIELSLVFMLLTLASLYGLLVSQYRSYDASAKTILEFWILQFPFAIHAGWITAASALNINVVVVDNVVDASLLLTVAILSLAVLHAIAMFVLYVPTRPNYTIPCVLAWANYWIYVELKDPLESISDMFDPVIITAVKNAAASVSVIILMLVALRVIIFGLEKKFFPKVLEANEEKTLGGSKESDKV